MKSAADGNPLAGLEAFAGLGAGDQGHHGALAAGHGLALVLGLVVGSVLSLAWYFLPPALVILDLVPVVVLVLEVGLQLLQPVR